MELPDFESYHQTNNGRFTAIKKAIGQIIAEAPERFLAIQEGASELTVVAGLATPQDAIAYYQARGIVIDHEAAEEIAETTNSATKADAEISINGLQTVTSMRILADLHRADPECDPNEVLPWFRADETTASLIPFDQASVTSASKTGDKEVTVVGHVQLKGVAGGHTAEEHTVRIEDGELLQELTLESIDDAIRWVTFRAQPAHDNLMRRCITVFGDNHSRIVSVLLKSLRDNSSIEADLNEIWLDYQGSALEEEAGPLLEEVRQRAFALQHSQELSHEHGTYLPSANKLAEIERLLGLN